MVSTLLTPTSFCFLVWRRPETGDRCKMGNGSRVTAACLSLPFRISQTTYCCTGGFLYASDMCSSTVLTLRICGYIAREARPCGRKYPLPLPCFAAVAGLRFSPCSPKGNGSQEGRRLRFLPSCPLGVGTPSPADSEMFRN